VTGQNLFRITMDPTDMRVFDYTGAGFMFTPLARVALMANYWRGSFRVHIACVASKFHSGRVRIWYDPKLYSGYNTGNLTVHLANMVWDINAQSEVSFTIPYEHTTLWKRVRSVTVAADETNSIGIFGFEVLNPLTSSSATVNPVYFQVFVSAGNDFQIASPNLKSLFYTFEDKNDWVAQGEGFDVKDKCEYPSMSMQCLKDWNYPILGTGCLYKNHSQAQCTELMTVRDFTNMMTIGGEVPQGTALDPLSQVVVTTWGTVYPQVNGDLGIVNALQQMMTLFLFWAGGVRVVVTGQKHLAAFGDIFNSPIDQPINSGIPLVNPTVVAAQPTATMFGSAFTYAVPDLLLAPLDVTIPYFARTRAQIVTTSVTFPSAPMNSTGGSQLTVTMVPDSLTTPPVLGTLLLLVGGGDDFILGWQMPVLPLYTA